MSTSPTERKCRIAEIVQYTCDVETSGTKPEVQCFPIPRIFRICPGRPTIEITKLVNVDLATGEVEVPPDSRDIPVEGKSWKTVVVYNRGSDVDPADPSVNCSR
ncbi:hypothetical protein Hypma_003438 [Hypsizygus marmoreus]|uniref:Uncharacterized protein n=1 Tax=Hypsizygus marmoreus TaxID=39966 RepID=A0A369J3V6_HYPMA|nr:hypothetical protein Hypma_003438 [Hypsizygus marmoreus]